MNNIDSYQWAYQNLVQAAPEFSSGKSSTSLKEFVDLAGVHAFGGAHRDIEAMDFLPAANRKADWVPVEILAQQWIPYAFDARTAEIRWCLPQGRAVQPFYDEYITHCRQNLVNALIAPRSSVKSFLLYAEQLPELPDPAGFIFHVSRCGSTLVSGCLAQLENCSVLSESRLLTEILLAKNMHRDQKKSLLRLCLYLQGRSSLAQPHVIVKWNAWDIFYWELIRELWPQVPVLLLVRDPVEVLASHVKSAGMHMGFAPALAQLHPVFAGCGSEQSLLESRIAVLESIMQKMLVHCLDQDISVLDYSMLNPQALEYVGQHFGIVVEGDQARVFQERFGRHSKQPDLPFHTKNNIKRQLFSHEETVAITEALMPTHHRLKAACIGVVNSQGN